MKVQTVIVKAPRIQSAVGLPIGTLFMKAGSTTDYRLYVRATGGVMSLEQKPSVYAAHEFGDAEVLPVGTKVTFEQE